MDIQLTALSPWSLCRHTQEMAADGHCQLHADVTSCCLVAVWDSRAEEQEVGSISSRIALPPFQPSPHCLSVARKSISGSLSSTIKFGSRVCLKVPGEAQMGRGMQLAWCLAPPSRGSYFCYL